MTNKTLVFVYGTLQKGERNHRFLERAEFVGHAKLKNIEIYENDWYPVIIDGTENCLGEIYSITPQELIKLAILEGYNHKTKEGEYIRVNSVVYTITEEKPIEVLLYKYNLSINTQNKIPSGTRWAGLKKTLK